MIAERPSRRHKRPLPIIRVFVSSTFSDLVFERNALQQHVWPVLEQLCLKDGFQFHAIDLRWGVSTEAGLDHRTMRICFEELRRSHEISPEPNFLILLGNRYGWRPLPEEISQEEFDRLVAVAKSEGDGRQRLPGTHGKSAEDVLNEKWRPVVKSLRQECARPESPCCDSRLHAAQLHPVTTNSASGRWSRLHANQGAASGRYAGLVRRSAGFVEHHEHSVCGDRRRLDGVRHHV